MPRYTQESYAEMILRFAIAAEYKHEETGTHIIRVSDYSTAITKALGLKPKDIEIVRFASIMHDIGKIGIPDRILHRRSFTEKDYELMKGHTIIGGKIFEGSDSPLLKAAGEIALSHHEWYDGSGYPHGLKGKDIPLYGRIVALADSFDAIVSDRGYKRSKSLETALAIIRQEEGTHFDPRVEEAFIKALPQIRKIFEANKTITDFLKETWGRVRRGERPHE